MAINLWLGLYNAPGEWPWTYMFLVVLQLIFLINPPGAASASMRSLGGARARHARKCRSFLSSPEGGAMPDAWQSFSLVLNFTASCGAHNES